MPTPRESLLAGRNNQPLDSDAIRRVANIFMGFDEKVLTHYDEHSKTSFIVNTDDMGNEYGEIVFGPDIYPKQSTIDPNSTLGIVSVVAHELTHYYRWFNKTELHENTNRYLDEALTSMEAIGRYSDKLKPNEVQELVRDAIGRLNLYIEQVTTIH